MPTVLELGQLASAVYGESPAADGWTSQGFRAASVGGIWDGLQAAVFARGSETVIAFRGTAAGKDVLADLKLGSGMNSSYFSAAEKFATDFQGQENVTLCGHSLGGAIAQIVGNRGRFRFVTFNAPGVAVFASRNIMEATAPMLAARTAGAALSVIRHPQQAWRDVKSTFYRVRGLNVCLTGDVVSQIGVHYGDVVRIPGTDSNPLTQHRMATMLGVLGRNAVGRLDSASIT